MTCLRLISGGQSTRSLKMSPPRKVETTRRAAQLLGLLGLTVEHIRCVVVTEDRVVVTKRRVDGRDFPVAFVLCERPPKHLPCT